MTNKQTLYLPPEWAEQDAIMLVWPHSKTDWAYMLEDVKDCYRRITDAITAEGERVFIVANSVHDTSIPLENKLVEVVECPTNDTWARDICPITTFRENSPVINDFKFNGWGLKFAADKDNLITSRLWNRKVFNGFYSNHLSFVLEGGSIECDGNGLLLTTSECLLSPNRNGGASKDEIENQLMDTFGLSKILWLDHGYLAGDDTDSHIDTLARFAPNNTILYVVTDNAQDEHYGELKQMESQLQSFTNTNGERFNLIPLPLPSPICDEDGERLPATYANFLIGNEFVLVPTYCQPSNDKFALEQISKAFPNRKIVGVDCRPLIKQHGSLHCVTMQFPKHSLKYE